MAALTKGTKFPSVVAEEIFSKVRGKSTVAKLANQIPVSFNGTDIFTFSMNNKLSIVAEGGEKPAGDFTVTPVKIAPIKVVYQGRVSDEFMYAADETRLQMMSAWVDACAKVFAEGLDLMAIHGVNPATNQTSALITSYLDQVQNVQATAGQEDDALEAAIAALGSYTNNGFALSPAMGAALGKIKANGAPLYPEFKMGGRPDSFYGVASDVNPTVSADLAIVGDWDAFKWGYAKDITFETIEYGNPDGQGDLKATNEIVLRAEAYVGFAVLDTAAFARVTA